MRFRFQSYILFEIIFPGQMMKLDFHFMGMNRNLYWYMGIFAMGLGMVRSFIIQHTNTSEAHEPLLSCISYTNYFPRHWRELRLSSIEVHDEFTDLFMLNVAIPGLHRSIFVQEMLGVIITPFILWFVLPDKSGEILAFLRMCTVEKKAVNCICSFADFSNDGFCRHGAMNQDEILHQSNDVRDQRHADDIEEGLPMGHGATISEHQYRRDGAVQPVENKFQKSFVGFKANNPLWEPPQEGQQLLCRLMETIDLRSDMDVDARRFGLPRSVHGPLGASGTSGRNSVTQRDPLTAANAAAAFISSSHFLPPEDAETVQNAVFQRYKTYGNLIGGTHSIASGGVMPEHADMRGMRGGTLGLSSGGRWGAYRADGAEFPFETSVSGRRLEIDEHLLNVLLMEYSETCAHGMPGGSGAPQNVMMHGAVGGNDTRVMPGVSHHAMISGIGGSDGVGMGGSSEVGRCDGGGIGIGIGNSICDDEDIRVRDQIFCDDVKQQYLGPLECSGQDIPVRGAAAGHSGQLDAERAEAPCAPFAG
jgi:hypothetical protein